MNFQNYTHPPELFEIAMNDINIKDKSSKLPSLISINSN